MGPVASAADTAARTRSPGAEDGEVIESLFANAADAQALAERLVAVHAPRRVLYEVPMSSAGLRIRPGMYGRLTWPEFGLAGGRAVWCSGRRGVTAGGVTLYLWG